jgi:uncharacterized OB-fold protein
MFCATHTPIEAKSHSATPIATLSRGAGGRRTARYGLFRESRLEAADTPTEAPVIPRQLPAIDETNAFFWRASDDGKLHICRCGDCGFYIHPPQPRCSRCHGANVAPAPVSGLAKVATYTVNRQIWMKGLQDPFVFAAVELAEQPQLYVFTDIVGCPVDEVRTGLPVEVVFEQRGDVRLPLFQPRQDAQ